MSLIFEALKKADAARARMQAGQPGLQDEVVARSAVPSPVSVFDPQAPLRPATPPAWARPRVAVWIVAGVALLGVLMLAFGPARRDGASPPAGPATPPPGPPAAAPVPTPGPAPGPTAAPAPPAPATRAAPAAPAARPPAAQPATTPAAATPAARPPAPQPAPREAPARPPASKPAPAPAAQAPAPAPAAVPSSPSAAVLPSLADLPPDLRASMPRLSVSGAVYSPDPSARMLLVNGQVLREGDTVAPGLVLERIGPRQAVLSWQGTRFQMKL